MEHIVQFGISIDDKMIKETVERNALNIVTKQIKNDCMEVLIGNDKSGWFSDEHLFKGKIRSMVDCNVKEFFEENKAAIIEVASEKLADKLYKSKKVREVLGEKILHDKEEL